MSRTLDERDIPCARVDYPRNLPVYNVTSKEYFNWFSPTLPKGYRNLHSGHSQRGGADAGDHEYFMEVSTPRGTSARDVRRNIAHLFGKRKFSVRK